MDFKSKRHIIRSILLSATFTAVGFLIIFIIEKSSGIDFTKTQTAIVNFALTSTAILVFFPRVIKVPFGRVSPWEFLKCSGLYLPKKLYNFILIGLIPAVGSLSGLIIGFQLLGIFRLDYSKITLAQAIFSLTPGIWEEVMFRGVIMIILIKVTKSIWKASMTQILLFALMHLKGFTFFYVLDVFSVGIIATGFTFLALRTKNLWPAVTFHFLHDTFVLFATSSIDRELKFWEQILQFVPMWIMIGISLLIVNRIIEFFNIKGEKDIYEFNRNNFLKKETQKKNNTSIKKTLIINTVGILVILFLSDIEKSYALMFYFFNGFFVFINLVLLFFIDRLGRKLNFFIFLLASGVAFFTAYDYYLQGSKTVYLFWILFGIIYLGLAVFKEFPRLKTE